MVDTNTNRHPIFFTFRSGVLDEQQEKLLTEAREWENVLEVDRLRPKAKRDDVKRLCYLYVNDSQHAKQYVEKLNSMTDVIYEAHSPSPNYKD